MNPETEQSCEETDAAIFSGDQFRDSARREALRVYLARWERGLKEYDEVGAVDASTQLCPP